MAEELKQEGNLALSEGRNYEAVSRYSEAISKEPTAALYCNRALAYTRVGKYAQAIADADQAIQLEADNVKAWYRKGQAQDANKEFEAMDAKATGAADESLAKAEELAQGLLEYGALGEIKKLRLAVWERREAAEGSPSIRHFEVIEELGVGNYTEVVLAVRKADGRRFALKRIEKSAVEKIKKRHPNVHNEIAMEKRILNQLQGSPSVVELFGTFQDYYTLYYLLELCEGGELWSRFIEGDKTVPTHASLARFWVGGLVEGLEHMHSHGVVHRDIKPENMMLSAGGHVKLIDFGTCKDLVKTDLNGPEFVGTPEFMAPEMVESKAPDVVASYEADIWATGVVAFQLSAGISPFKSQSPYLCFLRIKHANIEQKLPECLHGTAAGDFVRSTCKLEPGDRLGAGPKNIAKLKTHPYLAPLFDPLEAGQRLTDLPALVVPPLRELALRAVAHHAKTADHGEKRLAPAARLVGASTTPSLTPRERATVMRYLERTGALFEMRCFRLFFDSAVTARCARADACTHTHLGHTFEAQGRYEDSFGFVHVASPRVDGDANGAAVETLRQTVASINRQRPPGVVVTGGFTSLRFGDPGYENAVELFRRTMARVSESVPVMYCCGEAEAGAGEGASSSMAEYERRFGASWYALWCKGARFIVVNSALIARPALDPARAALQDRWIAEEFELTTVGSSKVFLISHRPIILPRAQDETPEEAAARETNEAAPAGTHEAWARRLVEAKIDANVVGSLEETSTATFTKTEYPPEARKEDEDQRESSIDNNDDDDDRPIVEDVDPAETREDEENSDLSEDEPEELHKTSVLSTAPLGGPEPAIRIVNVYEYTFKSKAYALDQIPTSI